MKEKYLNLIKNLRFYHDNLAYLQQVYLNKYLIIYEQKVVGTYATYDEAELHANANYPSGIHLIKRCQQLANVAETYVATDECKTEDRAA